MLPDHANPGALVARCRVCNALFVASVREREHASTDFDVIALGMRGHHTGLTNTTPHQCAENVRGMADVLAVVNGTSDATEPSYVAQFEALARQAELEPIIARAVASVLKNYP